MIIELGKMETRMAELVKVRLSTTWALKAPVTFGNNCQKPVFSLGASEHNAYNNKAIQI